MYHICYKKLSKAVGKLIDNFLMKPTPFYKNTERLNLQPEEQIDNKHRVQHNKVRLVRYENIVENCVKNFDEPD